MRIDSPLTCRAMMTMICLFKKRSKDPTFQGALAVLRSMRVSAPAYTTTPSTCLRMHTIPAHDERKKPYPSSGYVMPVMQSTGTQSDASRMMTVLMFGRDWHPLATNV